MLCYSEKKKNIAENHRDIFKYVEDSFAKHAGDYKWVQPDTTTTTTTKRFQLPPDGSQA
eukprot:m.249377 g.249377  ORF g.249377 m.249377 type:complete len:59 (+) comp22624_c0_seq7:99-275(+)